MTATAAIDRAPWVLITTGIHDRGGQDKANHALAQYLLDSGHSVHLVCHSVDPVLAGHSRATFHKVPQPGGPFFISEQVLDRYGRGLARRIVAEHPDARILVNGGNCPWPGINWSHYVHGAWKSQGSDTPGWFRAKSALNQTLNVRREAAAYRQARLILTNSSDTREHIRRLYQIDRERIRTVHLGCDPAWDLATPAERAAARQEFQLTPEERVAVFVGGIGWDDRKGLDVVVEAWRALAAHGACNVKLIVAGAGSALTMWQQRVAGHGLDGHIRFLGFSSRVRELLAAADLLISPARYEPYGLNVQEAICRGVPAIVSRSAGVAERYSADIDEALLDNPEDPNELTEKLLLWSRSAEAWRTRFQSFGRNLRRYRWSTMAQNMVEIVDSVYQPVTATR